jgi:hypothetical protein
MVCSSIDRRPDHGVIKQLNLKSVDKRGLVGNTSEDYVLIVMNSDQNAQCVFCCPRLAISMRTKAESGVLDYIKKLGVSKEMSNPVHPGVWEVLLPYHRLNILRYRTTLAHYLRENDNKKK